MTDDAQAIAETEGRSTYDWNAEGERWIRVSINSMLSLALSIRLQAIMADISLRGLDYNTVKRPKSEARHRGLSVDSQLADFLP